jgi:hypothetical protein
VNSEIETARTIIRVGERSGIVAEVDKVEPWYD